MSDDEKKEGAKVTAAIKTAYDNMTKKQADDVAKAIMKDKEWYTKEREEFNEKGYYTMKDGSKSTDNLKSKKSKEVIDEKKKVEEESGKKSGPKKQKAK